MKLNFKPDFALIFNNPDGKQLGRLDFNGPAMRFEGDADPSAKILFDFLAIYFEKRLKEEHKAGREEAIKEIRHD